MARLRLVVTTASNSSTTLSRNAVRKLSMDFGQFVFCGADGVSIFGESGPTTDGLPNGAGTRAFATGRQGIKGNQAHDFIGQGGGLLSAQQNRLRLPASAKV